MKISKIVCCTLKPESPIKSRNVLHLYDKYWADVKFFWSFKLLVACAYEYFECFDWNEYFEYMKFDLIVGSRRRHLVSACVCWV